MHSARRPRAPFYQGAADFLPQQASSCPSSQRAARAPVGLPSVSFLLGTAGPGSRAISFQLAWATLGQFILVDLASRALLKESDLASRCRGSRLPPPRPRVLECLTQPGSVKQGTRAPGPHAQLGRVLENNLSFEGQSLSPHPTPDGGVWRAGTHSP